MKKFIAFLSEYKWGVVVALVMLFIWISTLFIFWRIKF